MMQMRTDGPIVTRRDGAVLEVTLDRPKANAIDLKTSRIMGEVFRDFRDDHTLRVAILRAEGEKFFCPGWDLKAAADGDAVDGDYGVGGFGGLQELPHLNKPVIAAVNGICCGGGLELALSCDLILASNTATFALPEIRSGTVADAASIKLPKRIPYHVAMDLLLTGRWFDSDEALRWGLLKEICAPEDLLTKAWALARVLESGPPLVYAAIKEAGEPHGVVDFGMRALLSMRLEKNFPTWFRELRPIYGPFEGAMDRFVKLEKNDFIGREAAAVEHANGPKLRRVSFIVEATDADVMGDEPIWARVGDRDFGTVEKPHGYGAPRFGPDGRETLTSEADHGASSVRGIRDGEWAVVGWVTSGGYAHWVEKSMAQGYVPAELANDESEGLFEIEILGQRRPARINVEPPFDPSGERMRA